MKWVQKAKIVDLENMKNFSNIPAKTKTKLFESENDIIAALEKHVNLISEFFKSITIPSTK
jgi:hypothetical protein